MEFFFWDFSLLFSLCIFIASILFFSYISYNISKLKDCAISEFRVIDFIKAVKKECPVTFANKWQLLTLSAGCCRCWMKKFQFSGFVNSLHLYGTVCTSTCSPMYALSLIADVNRWGEWDNSYSSLFTEPFEEELKKDDFMLADQVVGVQKGTNLQSYIAMYRFLSSSERSVKWVLFWNAKCAEFMFFLIQPAVSKTVNCQSAITYIHGTLNPSNQTTTLVSRHIRNIKDFLSISQVHIVGSSFSPSTPILSVRESCSDMKSQEERPSVKSPNSASSIAFVLVPVMQPVLKYGFLKLTGFQVVISNSEKTLQENTLHSKEINTTDASVKVLKRAASDTCIQPSLTNDKSQADSSKTNETVRRNSLQMMHSDTKLKNSVLVKQKSLDVIKETVDGNVNTTQGKYKKAALEESKVRRFSESSIENTNQNSLSPQSELLSSDLQSDEESFVNLQLSKGGSEEYDKYEIFTSSASDFEIIDSAQQYLACKLADFLTQGNYGASELQAEMVLASQYDDRLGPGEQGIGSWSYHSSCKGITVLAKTITGRFMKIVSYLSQMDLPVPAKDAWKCVKNPRFRFISDETVKTVKIIERISNTQKLIHVYHESSGFLRKECTDFCLLQTEREEKNRYYSSFHSIEYEKCPLMTSVLRGSMRPSGWVVEKTGTKKCKITYLVQILVSSPDSLFIQEISTLVPQCLHNLKHYTMSYPK